MAYSLKKRKQLSKLSKKNKTKFRKAKKLKERVDLENNMEEI